MPVTDKDTVKAYDDNAQLYFEYSYHKILQYQLTQFLGYLPGKYILDAGCGSGRDTEYLVDLGYDITGIDASKALIEEAKSVVKADFRVMALEDLDFPDGTFDGVWCLASLFYIDKEHAKAVLEKFNKVLRDKGILYLGLIVGEGETIVKEKGLNMTPVKIQMYTQHEIEETLEQAGFEIVTAYIEDEEGTEWLNVFARKRSF